MQHLSGLDASFLYLESPETPMHVGGLYLYELPPGMAPDAFVDVVREHVRSRMHLARVFTGKLVNMPFELANPVWVHDDDVDLEYHVRSTVLPKPGDRAQLDRLVGRLHSSLLDRSRPLWEFYVIEGVQSPPGTPEGVRHVAFYSKVHHAAVDGEAGVALAQALLDISPVPRHVRPAPRKAHAGADNFGIAELAAAGLKNSVVQAVRLGKTLPTLGRAALRWLRPAADEGAPGTGALATAKPGWLAPKTPINGSVTNQRVFSSFSIPMAELKGIAKAHGVTLNDVVLTICGGALRRYLADLGSKPDRPLLAGVPVSLREEGNTEMTTQASIIRISLASDIQDPVGRLLAVHAASTAAKALTAGVKDVLPTDFPSLGAPWLMSGLAALWARSKLANSIPPIVNVAVSNVPGPKLPLYLAGAKMLTFYPTSLIYHSMALNVTVQSYAGNLDWGLVACRRSMPDLVELAGLMQAEHAALLKATQAAHAPAAEQGAQAAQPQQATATKMAGVTTAAESSKAARAAKSPKAPRVPAVPKAPAKQVVAQTKAKTSGKTATKR